MLDFLTTATVADVAESNVTRKGGVRKQRNPEGMAIRVFKDGSVYPSQELVDEFNLEYDRKDGNDPGNGFDVIDTDLYPNFQVGKRILIISPVPKKAAKVDLFASTTYDEDGNPKALVTEQGSTTYGKAELVPALKNIYGIELNDEQRYVDLVLVANPTTNQPWELPNGREVTFIPKRVSRGDAKGQITTIRRERPQFWALLPSSLIEQPAAGETELPENEEDAEDLQDVDNPVEVAQETED